MKDFTYSYPAHVYFGKGALANALKAELPVEAKKVLLAYGGGSIKKNGIYEEVTGLLQELGAHQSGEFPAGILQRLVDECPGLLREIRAHERAEFFVP